MNNGKKAHVLAIPYPAQGHMLPLLDLIHQLAASRRPISITIAVTPKNLPIISPLLTAAKSIVEPLVLPFPEANSLIPSGVENVKDIHSSFFFPMNHVLRGLHPLILRWARSSSTDPVTAIISDMFVGWTTELAAELGVPRLVFSPSGALTIAMVNYLWRRMPEKRDEVIFDSLPGSPSFPWSEISSNYRRYKEGDLVSESVKEGFVANMASWGYVLNTFDELEGRYLRYLKDDDLGHERVWAVGPLCLPRGENTSPDLRRRGGPSSSEVMTWLDMCPSGSVVYVCFGSQATLTEEQTAALAAALERSEARFVWVLRDTVADAGSGGATAAVTSSFEGRVAGRGWVIRGWAPQAAILGHAAVGAFLTHAGWNSALEGIAAGVFLLTWPLGADQFANARLLEAAGPGLAVRVATGPDAAPEPEKLAGVLTESVNESARSRRDKASELRKKATLAVLPGGSSFRDFEALLDALTSIE